MNVFSLHLVSFVILLNLPAAIRKLNTLQNQHFDPQPGDFVLFCFSEKLLISSVLFLIQLANGKKA